MEIMQEKLEKGETRNWALKNKLCTTAGIPRWMDSFSVRTKEKEEMAQEKKCRGTDRRQKVRSSGKSSSQKATASNHKESTTHVDRFSLNMRRRKSGRNDKHASASRPQGGRAALVNR